MVPPLTGPVLQCMRLGSSLSGRLQDLIERINHYQHQPTAVNPGASWSRPADLSQITSRTCASGLTAATLTSRRASTVVSSAAG
eukprot:7383178-Pyramimonas_sp.AAC.1